MTLSSVRIGEFQETEALEFSLHWRNILEGDEDRFEILMRIEPTSEEVTSSPVAMDLVFRLDQE